jgi:hypothetical protein
VTFCVDTDCRPDVLSMMQARDFLHAPVVDAQRKPSCVVNARDALRELWGEGHYEKALLRDYVVGASAIADRRWRSESSIHRQAAAERPGITLRSTTASLWTSSSGRNSSQRAGDDHEQLVLHHVWRKELAIERVQRRDRATISANHPAANAVSCSALTPQPRPG